MRWQAAMQGFATQRDLSRAWVEVHLVGGGKLAACESLRQAVEVTHMQLDFDSLVFMCAGAVSRRMSKSGARYAGRDAVSLSKPEA